MNLKPLKRINIACAAACLSQAVSAAPIISIDLDPAVGGIQSARTVTIGDTFTVDLVLTADTTPLDFDSILLDLFFNDAGAVLSRMPGATPIAGSLADNAPNVFDTIDFMPVDGGDPLSTNAALGTLLPGFASRLGTLGMNALGVPFSIAPTASETILNVSFTAAAGGTSILDVANTSPGSGAILAFGGGVLDTTTQPASLTVDAGATTVPEPPAWLLIGFGLLALAVRRGY